MRIDRMLRWTALVAILAAMAPAPAEAQLGRFIKNKLKQKIAQAVVESVVPADTPVAGAPAEAVSAAPASGQSVAPLTAKKGAPGRAVKGGAPAPAPAPASGLTFNEYVLEMTPPVLDRLEQAVAAEAAEVQAMARMLARMRDKAGYDKCSREVMASPQGKAMMALLDKGDMRAYQDAAVEVGKVQEEKCGPPPSHYNTVKDGLARKRWLAVEKASQFTDRQYDILKERALPFCSLAKPASGEVKIPVRPEVFLVYSPAEVQNLSGRCAKLLPGLKASL